MRDGAHRWSIGKSRLVSRTGARWITASVPSIPSAVSVRLAYIAPALFTSASSRSWLASNSLAKRWISACGEIRDHELDRLIAALGLDLGRGGLAFTPVAPNRDDPRAQVRKTFCGGLTYPASSAGDEHDLAIHNPLRDVHVPPPCSSGCFPAPQWHQVASSCPARR